MNNSFLLALATLIGTIIGAGIFGLPYVVAQSGIIPGLIYFFALGGVVLLFHLMFGEIALRTKTKHRLIGYASIYLGEWAKKLITFSTIAGIIGALLAYIILAGDFLSILVSSFSAVSASWLSLAFWAGCSIFVLRGIQTIAKLELLISTALFLVVWVIFVFAAPHIELENFPIVNISSSVFMPYGVVLFAFLGLSAIPEIAELFKSKREKRNLDNLILWSSIICGGLYILFTLLVVGVSGTATSQDALSGLVPFVGEKIVLLGALFGVLAITASFLVLGNYLKNSLRYDYKLPYGWSVAIALLVPVVLFVAGLREFILVVGLVGAMVAAIEGPVIVLVFQKAKHKGDRIPEYSMKFPRGLSFILIAALLVGAVIEIATRL